MIKLRGYTLIELIVALGLFSFVMLLSSGAYLFMIGLNRQAQGVATGIDSLSFALETMTRTIRTGYAYSCDNCFPSPGNSLTLTSSGGEGTITYARGTQEGPNGIVGDIVETSTGAILTDPSVNVTSLAFYVTGTKNADSPPDDFLQPHVTIVVSGTVIYGPDKTEAFNVQTGATMRGPDLSSSTINAPPPPEPPPSAYIVEGKQDDNSPGDNGQLYSWNYSDSANITTTQLHDGNTSSGGVTGNDRMAAVKLSQQLSSSRNFTVYGNWGSRFSVGYSTNGSSWTTINYGRDSSPYTFSVPSGALYIAAAVEQGGRSVYEIADSSGSSGVPSISISPAVSGKSIWNFSTDGPLVLGSYGSWTVTPGSTFSVSAKMWGAGGSGAKNGGAGAGGGYTSGTLTLSSGTSYVIWVGQGGFASGGSGTGTFGGGGDRSRYNAGWGGGLSGIFTSAATQGNAIMIAGGGGGGGTTGGAGSSYGGGGGLSGQDGLQAGGGTQSSGGASSSNPNAPATAGFVLKGGTGGDRGGSGGGGYYGGGGDGEVGNNNKGYVGGGGSGYYNPGLVSGSTITASGQTPANSSDSARGTSGNGGDSSGAGANGLVKISYP